MPTTTETELTIISQIIKAEKTYVSANKRRQLTLARLSGMNVAFADIHNRLLAEAKAEGYYSTDLELKKAKEDRKEWAVLLFQFIDWTYRTYQNYNEPLRKTRDVVKKGAVAPKVVNTKEGSVLTEKRAEKILEKDANLPILTKALEGKGLTVMPKKLGNAEIDVLLGDEENVDAIIEALRERGLI